MADKPDLQITQVKSLIGSQAKQRATLRGLGLRRIRHTVVQPDRPEIRGMIAKVSHLVEVKEADGTVVRPLKKRSSETKLAAGNISPVEQHSAGLAATDATERPPAPDSPASPTDTTPDDQPDTGPSGETSTSSAPGTPADDVTADADDTARDAVTDEDETS